MARNEETPGKWPVLVLIVSVLVIFVAGLCTIAGYSARENDWFYLLGYLAMGMGLILLVLGAIGLGSSLRRLALARGILPRWLLPLFVGVPVVLLGLLTGLYFVLGSAPRSAGHLRLQQAMGKRDFVEAYLAGANLRGADLSGADLSGAYLGGADLGQADLSGADLSAANMREADLSGANLSGADLMGANLMGANLSGAILERTNLGYAQLDGNTQIADRWRLVWDIRTRGGTNRDLRGADLSGAYLGYADLGGADLSGADLSGASLERAYLEGANLRGADLRGADLSRVTLTGADLTGAQVTDEQLARAWKLEGATMPDGSVHQ